MHTLITRVVAAGALAIAVASSLAAQAPAATLYKRLGGYDAIAAVVDDFVPRVATDPQLGKFFAGAGKDTQAHIRQLAVDFICNATGGPCLYIGRSLKTAHAGLGITESDWEVAMKHLAATLDKLRVAKPERDDVLAAIGGLKGDIVDKRGM
jgi:hemoglobin